MQSQFEKLGVKLVANSTDHLTTREQSKNSMERLVYKARSKVKIDFPMVADEDMSVS